MRLNDSLKVGFWWPGESGRWHYVPTLAELQALNVPIPTSQHKHYMSMLHTLDLKGEPVFKLAISRDVNHVSGFRSPTNYV